jgi:hypothetical protein
VIKNKNHNTIYFLTTLSVYLGLVFVGGSPQALSYSKTTSNSQPHSFEISAKTNSVLSKLDFKTDSDNQRLLPYAVFGVLSKEYNPGNSKPGFKQISNLHAQISAGNNQVLILTNFPRASI